MQNNYNKLRKEFLNEHPLCQAKMRGCTHQATDVHHKRGRGKYYLDTSSWLAVCRSCHEWIHRNTADAIELGFVESRLKNEESSLSEENE